MGMLNGGCKHDYSNMFKRHIPDLKGSGLAGSSRHCKGGYVGPGLEFQKPTTICRDEGLNCFLHVGCAYLNFH